MPWKPNELEKLKQSITCVVAIVVETIVSIFVQCAVGYLITLCQITWLNQLVNTQSGWLMRTALSSIIAHFCVQTTRNFIQIRLRIRKELKKLEEESDSS